MIIKDTEKRRIGKTGVSYYTVDVKCDQCGLIREIERNRAKKQYSNLCSKCYSKSEIKAMKLKGKEPPNKQIRCLVPCEYCKKEKPRLKREIKLYKHTWCNSKCQMNWQLQNGSLIKRGKNSHLYKHGKFVNGAYYDYPPEFKTMKRLAKVRDKYNCKNCNKNFSGKNSKFLDVHHIDENKKNNNLNNLISLCKSCHLKTHWEIKKSRVK